MLRRILAVLAALLLLLCGCGGESYGKEEIPVGGDPYKGSCVVYYEHDTGYLVPVLAEQTWGRDTLRSVAMQIVADGERQVFLEEASLEDGTASLNIISAWLGDVSEKRAANIVTSLVNSLCGFPAVDQVKLTINGTEEKLGGIDLREAFSPRQLNVFGKGDQAMTVYYKLADSGLMLPMTKRTKNSTPEAAVETMLGSPNTDSIMGLFPAGTELLEVDISESGVLRLNFSSEFNKLADDPYLENIVLTGLDLTCREYPQVRSVKIFVEGKEYIAGRKTSAAAGAFGNDVFGIEKG